MSLRNLLWPKGQSSGLDVEENLTFKISILILKASILINFLGFSQYFNGLVIIIKVFADFNRNACLF